MEFFHSVEMESALGQTKPAPPVLVKRIGEKNSFHYIISFGEGREWGPANMLVACGRTVRRCAFGGSR